MKKMILILTMLLLFTSCARDKDVIAEVNGENIMKSDFETEYAVYRNINVQKFGEDLLNQVQENGKTLEEELKEGVLKKMILEKIISEEMIERQYDISSEELDKTTEEYYEKLGGEAKAKEFIENSGMSEEFFKESIKKSIYLGRHKILVLGEMDIKDEDIKNYYDSNAQKFEKIDCLYILLKTEEEARDVKSQIESGLKFEDLALAKSIDPQTAQNGGALGWVKKGEYPKEFEDAAFHMEVGNISNPIKTDLGYYIIKINDKKTSFEDLKDDVKEEYENALYESYLDELQKKADIKIYNENGEK